MGKNTLDAVKMVKENGGVPLKLIQKELWKRISGLVAISIVPQMMVCYKSKYFKKKPDFKVQM